MGNFWVWPTDPDESDALIQSGHSPASGGGEPRQLKSGPRGAGLRIDRDYENSNRSVREAPAESHRRDFDTAAGERLAKFYCCVTHERLLSGA